MDILGLALSALSMVGSLVVYVIGLRIKSDITEAQEKLNADIERHLPDKVLAIVNGQYVRSDLYRHSIQSLRELVESRLDALEKSLTVQISDLKDRIQL